MKKLFLFLMVGFVVALASCNKPTTKDGFAKHIQGEWRIDSLQLNHMNNPLPWPEIGQSFDSPLVKITESHFYGGWFYEPTSYEIIDKGLIKLYFINGNGDFNMVDVDIKKRKSMHLHTQNNDQMWLTFVSK